MLHVKIRKLIESAKIPQYAKEGDAGLDLTATNISYDADNVIYHSGLSVEIPQGYVGLLFPRSSNSKTQYYLTNSVGVIDSGYRGEIKAVFKHRDSDVCQMRHPPYAVGERFAQLIIMPYPHIQFDEVTELSQTERGNGGYGSTGK